MRVAFFHIGSEIFGGGSKMLLRLLQHLDKERFDPILLSNEYDELCEQAKECGIELHVVPFRGALNTYNRKLLSDTRLLPPSVVRIVQFNWAVRSYLTDADVIWCKNLRAVLTLLPFLSVSTTPVVWNIGLGLESDGKVTYLNSIALRAVDYVFIESEEQAQRVFTDAQYNTYQHKFTVFHKGIDTNEFDPTRFGPPSGSQFRIGTAASFTPRKGLEHLIDAFASIHDEISRATLWIAGEAPDGKEAYKKRLQQRVRQHGLEDQVRFLGWVEDMPWFFSQLDCFVLPSLNEGIPGVVREALAMEVPTIATDVGGTSDVIVDGETGILVDPKSPEAIARSAVSLWDAPQKRRRMGTRGRDRIESEFSVSKYVRDYQKFLYRIDDGGRNTI